MNKESNKPLKVIFYHIMRENFSGAQKNIYRLLMNLNKKKVNPLLLGQSESPLMGLIEEIPINTMIVPFPSELEVYDQKFLKFNIFTFFGFFKGLHKYNKKLVSKLENETPEIIWCDNIRTLITIFLACKKLKVKIIWNIWSEPKGKIAWLLHRIGFFLADTITLEYKNQGKKIFGILVNFNFFHKKVLPLYTGVSDFEEITGSNIREELELSSDDKLIIMASNILAGKGQIDLIKSIQDLLKESSDIHLLIAGTAVDSSPESLEYDKYIKQYVLEHKLEKNIHFIGWRSDMRDVLSNSDIYASSSYTESFPVAVREAMLASLPIVVTDVGGTCELVDLGKNGYLFDPGDIDDLTHYLRLLINDIDLRKSMGERGKMIINEEFSTKEYVKNFEIMLENTIAL